MFLLTRSRFGQICAALIKEEARYSIEVAWPVQRIGFIPVGGVQRASAIHSRLSSFQPETKEQELLQEAALRQFNTYFENKRTRLYGVTASIPAVMWLTVGIGAAINIILIWLFRLRLDLHLLLGGLISFFNRHHDLFDSLVRQSVPRRIGRIVGSFSTDL
jgi:hypothetical protein